VAPRLALGLDNSLDFVNIALSLEDSLLEERHTRYAEPPSRMMPGAVSELLKSHGYAIEDLSHIVVTLGPGSFTGIRVALAFCKGLSVGLRIPLIGVPTLDVLASPFSFMEGYYLCPLIDAKKGEVFTALYRALGERIERLTEYRSLKPGGLTSLIRTPCLCFGTGVRICADLVSPVDGITVIKSGFSRISGERLLALGVHEADLGEKAEIKPIYGRRSEAEIKFGLRVV
jgi:tRNA threonylcarbamoyladenosine biosynthesis protein TsaB